MLATLDHIEPRDAGPKAPGSERFCVVERAVKPVAELIRFVAGPDGRVVPDVKRKLPGRGVWVTARRAAVAQAVKRGAFQRALKAGVQVPADLPDEVERLLARAALDALSIAHKAGRVITGFERVERALAAQQVSALIHATDAAPDGVRKLAAAVRRQGNDGKTSRLSSPAKAGDPVTGDLEAGHPRPDSCAPQNTGCPAFAGHDTEDGAARSPEGAAIPLIRAFTESQLDLALGRPHVIHAALLGGREGDSFLARWQTLERYTLPAGREAPNRAGHEAVQPVAARNWERND